MNRDALADGLRVAHDVGLAAWLGGTMFGKFGLNPAVAQVSSRAERGSVMNAAWSGYGPVAGAALGAIGVGWFGARAAGAVPDAQDPAGLYLQRAKDVLVAGALLGGAASAIQGQRLSRQAPEGAVPIEQGTEPAPETPRPAARIQRTLSILSTLNVLTGVGLVGVNAVLSQRG